MSGNYLMEKVGKINKLDFAQGMSRLDAEYETLCFCCFLCFH